MLKLSLGTAAILMFAIGCGGSSASGTSAGGSTSSSAGASSSSAGASSSSGGTSSSGGSFSTSVPASTSLGSLTSDQVASICADLNSYLTTGSFASDLSDYECKSIAVISAATASSDAAAQTACKSAEASCTPTTGTQTGTCTPPDSTCTATVGELTTCLNDLVKAVQGVDDSIPSCDTLTVAQADATLAALASDAGAGLADPPSCVSYEAKCPDSSMLPQGM
jgi:hypothetical protein